MSATTASSDRAHPLLLLDHRLCLFWPRRLVWPHHMRRQPPPLSSQRWVQSRTCLPPPLLPCHRSSTHRPSSCRLPRCCILFSAPPVAVRERPAVDPSCPQAFAPTDLKPTPSAFRHEHVNPPATFSRPLGLTSPPRASPRPRAPRRPTVRADGHRAAPLIGAPTQPTHTAVERPVR
jgi:hypothetical protein